MAAKKKNTVGRPTKLTPELVKKAQHYLDNFKEEYGDSIPSVVGLALVVGVRRETLHVWANKDGGFYNEEIAEIMADLNATQERVLINSGLNGAFNSNITKLVLGKHGYHDKQDTHVKEFNVNIGGKDADTL
ncbi:hypothetical protein KAR10_01095 [bacterium]|nr:hypothetical protein [bacterium]